MAAEKDKSAPRRKTEDEFDGAQGRKPHQRLKAYLVLQILQKKTDEEHPLSANKIAAELAAMGIHAERRGIYEDIKEINRANYLLLPFLVLTGTSFVEHKSPSCEYKVWQLYST